MLPIHSPFFYPSLGKKKWHLNLLLHKGGSPFFKHSDQYILLALLKLGTVTFLTRMFEGKKIDASTLMAQPCMCRLIGIHPVLI